MSQFLCVPTPNIFPTPEEEVGGLAKDRGLSTYLVSGVSVQGHRNGSVQFTLLGTFGFMW